MLTCIIIEDQPPAQRILAKYIEDIGTLNLKGTFSDAIKAMEMLKSTSIDLVFLDIHLPKISGFDFLEMLPNHPHIILTTAFPDYALQSYEHHVVDYLLKPFSFQRFAKAVSKVPSPVTETTTTQQGAAPQPSPSDSIFIKSGHEHIKISVTAIHYIRSGADYTEVFVNAKKHLTLHALKYWLDRLGTQHFCQVHKSYIVNVEHIQKVAGNQIYLTDNTVIPIGRAYKDKFVNQYLR